MEKMEKNQNVEKNQNEVDAELEKIIENQNSLFLQNLKSDFKSNSYNRSVLKINLLSNENLKNLKDEKKLLKDLTTTLENGIKYNFKNNNGLKSINVGNFNFDQFKKVVARLTTENFTKILNFINIDLQKSCLSEAILENNKAKNISDKDFEYKINAMQVVKSFVKFIDATFNKLYVTKNNLLNILNK